MKRLPHNKGKRILCAAMVSLFLLTSGTANRIPAEEVTTQAAAYTDLTYGTNDSAAVKAMQNRLRELGYMTCSSTGGYYDQTVKSVKLFLAAVQMDGNGKTATVEMQEILFSDAAPRYGQADPTKGPDKVPALTATPAPEATKAPEALTTLKYCMESDAVKRMQLRLNELGYISCSATGGYYSATVSGVKLFLKALGMSGNGKVATVEMQEILFSDRAPRYGEAYDPATDAPEATETPAPTATPAPTKTPYQTLRANDSGSDAVYAMQVRLRELGYISCSPTGGYFAKTVSGVKAFLKAIGMDGDGKTATPEMQEILFSQYAPKKGESYVPAPTATPEPTATPAPTKEPVVYTTLKANMSGSDAVKAMQIRLKELGYVSCSPTGGYFSATISGVKAFLKAISMDGDGKTATPEMQQILFSDRAPRYGEPYNPEPTATPEPTKDPSLTYATLSYGETSDAIYAMQERLAQLGYLTVAPTGGYYAKTVAAVKAFLQAHNMTGDGNTATPEMQALLFADEDDTPPDYSDAKTDIILSKGDKGAQVALLIQRLTELKFYKGDSVESYTADVSEAVKWFQNSNKLDADGVAGPKTLTKLYSDSVVSADDSTTGNDEAPSETDGDPIKPKLSKAIAADWNDSYYFGKSSGIFKVGAVATVTDVATGISYQVKRVGGYNHADVEPLTQYDTWQMFKMYNQKWSWTRHAVYVTVGGVTLAGSANGYPHPDDHIADNGMDGHTCIHFSGSMTHGSQKVDPDHQDAVKKATEADLDKVQDLVNSQK